MKTLTLALIAVLVTCSLFSLASTDGFKSKANQFKVVKNMTVGNASQLPGLVVAIHAQVDEELFMNGGSLHDYIADVVYKGILYRISGTREDWIRFFKLKGKEPVNTEYRGLSTN